MKTYKMTDNRWTKFEEAIYHTLKTRSLSEKSRKRLKHFADSLGFYPDQADEIIAACDYEFKKSNPYIY